MGLLQVARAVSFLNNDCKMVSSTAAAEGVTRGKGAAAQATAPPLQPAERCPDAASSLPPWMTIMMMMMTMTMATLP